MKAIFSWFFILLGLAGLLFGCSDALTIYQNRHAPQSTELTTITFKVLSASAATPNFKVQFSNGDIGWLSFPQRWSLNPKGGLTFLKLGYSKVQNVVGCLATAKINTVPSFLRHENQIWDFECPATGVHYGLDVAMENTSEHPRFELISNFFMSLMFFVIGLVFFAIVRSISAALSGRKPRSG